MLVRFNTALEARVGERKANGDLRRDEIDIFYAIFMLYSNYCINYCIIYYNITNFYHVSEL